MLNHIMLLLLCAAGVWAEDAVYSIQRTSAALEIDGRLDEVEWLAAPAVGAFVFPWWEEGAKEQTVAKMLWDDVFLYVGFLCEDAHIAAEATLRDEAVYNDDCVEVFTAPNPDLPDVYFNLEMNVLGIQLDDFHPGESGIPKEEIWDALGVRISTSIAGTLNDDEDQDRSWILEAAIPFAIFDAVAVHTPPRVGDVWHLNLNRLGGWTNAQFSQWRASRTETPNFHVPADFGRVVFGASTSPFWAR